MLDREVTQHFGDEIALIGQILTGYSDLEIDLMLCAKAVCVDLDTVLKAMFRSRGETNRINVADAFGRQRYHALGIGNEFKMAIEAVRHCLKIRNKYAHCKWWDDYTGKLAFANLEEIAKEDSVITDFNNLTTHYVNVHLLNSQLAYFEYADRLLIWLIQEGNARAGREARPDRLFPQELERPPLFIQRA